MGKRKFLVISVAVLAFLLAGSSLVSAQDGPVRVNESFVLGDTSCQMNVVLEGDQVIAANVAPAYELPPEPPPSTVYSFSFSGVVASVTNEGGTPPIISVSPGDNFSGTFTYDFSTFVVSNSNEYSVYYTGIPSSVGSMSVSFPSQAFESTSFLSSLVNNNGGPNGVNDYYYFAVQPVSPVPPLNEQFNYIQMSLHLQDDNGDVLSGLDYPTSFILSDWSEVHQILINIYYGIGLVETVRGTVNSLSPAPAPFAPSQATSPVVQQSNGVCEGELSIEFITDTLICDDDGSGSPILETCEPKISVERNIMEKSGDGSRYCYYTTTGQRICKTF